MNFLAHLYLSGDDPMLLSGNFIGDSVKGRRFDGYPVKMQEGIRLHRLIDDFTDNHPLVLEEKKRLMPVYRKFSGVVLDMFYDHFLADNWERFHDLPLNDYTIHIYRTLRYNQHHFPPKSREVLHWMSANDWLSSYKHIDGIKRSLEGMARRTRFNTNMNEAYITLRSEYDSFRQGFFDFFPALVVFCGDKIEQNGEDKS